MESGKVRCYEGKAVWKQELLIKVSVAVAINIPHSNLLVTPTQVSR